MSDFGHNFNRRDSWKRMNEWSHNLNDEDLDELFSDHAEDYENSEQSIKKSFARNFFVVIFSLLLLFGVLSLCVWQFAKVLGFTEFTFMKSVAATLLFCVLRYTDAGIIKQIK